MRDLECGFHKESNRLIERFTIVLMVCFLLYGLLCLYRGFISFFLWHIFCVCFIALMNYVFFKNKKNNVKVILGYLILCADIFFFITIGGYQTGMDLFYVPIILSIPLFFNFAKEKYFVLVSFVIITSFMILGLITRKFFYHESYYKFYHGFFSKYFLGINISFVLIAMGVLIHSIYIRHLLLNKHWLNLLDKSTKLNIVTQKLITMTSASELVDLAKNNDQVFYQKFILAYPDLIEKIYNLCPNICRTELELCAYLKLNFSTKQIAMYTNSTVKSVESKKYRVRKKFNLKSDDDMYVWINCL